MLWLGTFSSIFAINTVVLIANSSCICRVILCEGFSLSWLRFPVIQFHKLSSFSQDARLPPWYCYFEPPSDTARNCCSRILPYKLIGFCTSPNCYKLQVVKYQQQAQPHSQRHAWRDMCNPLDHAESQAHCCWEEGRWYQHNKFSKGMLSYIDSWNFKDDHYSSSEMVNKLLKKVCAP